jgi:hypothetical protein
MTWTAWRQGAINALICGVGLLVACLAVTRALSLFIHRGLSELWGIVLSVMCGLALLAFLGTWLYGVRAKGRILLDCGPHPMRWLFVANGLFFVTIGIAMVFATAGPMFSFVFGAYWLIMAFGRLQVTENGIWQYWGLLRWRKISSYRWADDNTLLVTPRARLLFLRGALPVPPEHKKAVDSLLSEFCPVEGSRT